MEVYWRAVYRLRGLVACAHGFALWGSEVGDAGCAAGMGSTGAVRPYDVPVPLLRVPSRCCVGEGGWGGDTLAAPIYVSWYLPTDPMDMVGEVKGWGYARQDIVDRGLAVVLAICGIRVGGPWVRLHAGAICVGSSPPCAARTFHTTSSYRGRWGQGLAQAVSAVLAPLAHYVAHSHREAGTQHTVRSCVET